MRMKKRTASIEGIVTNLIVDQQAMVTSFNARGDRHSRSLDQRWTMLTALGRFQERSEVNINILVDKCHILHTQVESMGDNLCRWVIPECFLLTLWLTSPLGVESIVVVGIGRMLWSMLMSTLKGLTTFQRLLRRM